MALRAFSSSSRYLPAAIDSKGTMLAFEGARHGVRVSCNDHKKDLRRLIGKMRALFPISDSPEREMKPGREFLLRQVQLLAQRADSRHTAGTCKLRLARGRTVGI